jgi:hypothetical protein
MYAGTLLKCVLIALLVVAGYYVISPRLPVRREGFDNNSNNSNNNLKGTGTNNLKGTGTNNNNNNNAPSSADVPNVVAEKSSNLLKTSMSNMMGLLQISNNRNSYEGLITTMDTWTQAKVVASLNALAAQMLSDSSNQGSMMSPPSEKTVSLINAINSMTTFQTASLPAIMKSVNNA